jgi:hypothetical protein
MYKYFMDQKMESVAEALVKEKLVDAKTANYVQLKSYLDKRDFGKAIVLVQQILSQIGNSDRLMMPCNLI